MSYGDAYIYAVVISPETAKKIFPLEEKYYDNLRACSNVHGPLEDIDVNARARWHKAYDAYNEAALEIMEILRANVIDVIYMTCDSSDKDALYYTLDGCGYKPMFVKSVVVSPKYRKELGKSSPLAKHSSMYVVFRPVHMDDEDDWLDSFNRRKDGGGHITKIKHHIEVYDYKNVYVDGKYLFPEMGPGLARGVQVDAWCVGGEEGVVAFFYYDRFLCEAHGDDGHWWLVGILDKAWTEKYKMAVADIEEP